VEKIPEIVVAEIFEAVAFIILLMLCRELTTSFFDTCFWICLVWAILGIATPFIIWYGLEEVFRG